MSAVNRKAKQVKKIKKNLKRQTNISYQSQIAERLIWLSRAKVPFTTIEGAQKMMDNRFEKNKLTRNIPKIKSKVELIDKYVKEVYYLGDVNNANTVIIYLHGGSYIYQPLRSHWKFLDKLVQKSDIPVILPLYPKAPEYDYTHSYKMIKDLYLDLVNQGITNVIIMGDSAGGGLALGFSQYVIKHNLPKVFKTILLSPWLDLSLKNTKLLKYEKKDPMISHVGLRHIGLKWANNNDPTIYKLSPINGNFNGLNEISIFIGTHEIFLPDNRLLKIKALESGVSVNYFEYKNMNHVFPLFPIPEANKAFIEIVNIIKGTN